MKLKIATDWDADMPDGVVVVSEQMDGDDFVCECDQRDTAEMIVRAVNNHQRLVDACEHAAFVLANISGCVPDSEFDGERDPNTARDALQAALTAATT